MSDKLSRDPTEASQSVPDYGEPSEYQRDCAEYYRLLRSVHTGVYTAPGRIDDEINKHRYRPESPSWLLKVRPLNLHTFFELLHRLCGDGPEVHGIDVGCGSHWFVDYTRSTYGWSTVGYDPDNLAIDLARRRFPQSARAYRTGDPVQDRLPEANASQDFVVCNAVLQHLDHTECERAIAEMGRVLKPGGYCLLIFQYWTPALAARTDTISESIRVMDSVAGKVMFQDPTMRKAIATLPAEELNSLTPVQREGWRLLHLFPVEDVEQIATNNQLLVARDVPLKDDPSVVAVLKYRSGKGIPTVCMIFRKSAASSGTGRMPSDL